MFFQNKSKNNNKSQKSKYLVVLLLFLALPLSLGAITWDSTTDPLVTKSWVDSYVAKKSQEVEAKITKLKNSLGTSVLEMWINKTAATRNGQKINLDSPPTLKNDRTYLPLRFLGESLGAEMVWDNTKKAVTYKKAGVSLELFINQKTYKVNGVTKTLDSPPVLQNNRVLVPVRVVSDELGAKVDWENQTKKITITY